MATGEFQRDNFGLGTTKSRLSKKFGIWLIEQYEKPMRAALAATNGKFDVPGTIEELAEKAQRVISLGTQAGEGWLLVGEIVELIEHGTPNVICAQPFACLPNHVIGRGMFKELRAQYPQANLVSIDYDPGASEVNQLNRIKLMIATAHKAVGTKSTLADWSDGDEFTAVDPQPVASGVSDRAAAAMRSLGITVVGQKSEGCCSGDCGCS